MRLRSARQFRDQSSQRLKRLLTIVISFIVVLGGLGIWKIHTDHDQVARDFRAITWEIDHNIGWAWKTIRALFEGDPIADREQHRSIDQLPLFRLHVSSKTFWKLESERQLAIENEGSLKLVAGGDSFTWSKALLEVENQPGALQAKVRLKGSASAHLKGRFPSLRIRTLGDDSYKGMVRFDLQGPEHRDALHHLILSNFVEEAGIFTPQAFLVRYHNSNEYQGVGFIEEVPSSSVMERLGRKPSITIKFGDNRFVSNMVRNPNYQDLIASDTEPNALSIAVQEIKPVVKRDREKFPEYWAQASGLLRAFQERRAPASRIFKVRELGYFLAFAEIFCAPHAVSIFNLRFSLDPVESKLEPIWWDPKPQNPDASAKLKILSSSFVRLALQDPIIFREFSSAIQSITNRLTIALSSEKVEKESLELRKILQREIPGAPFLFDAYVERARSLSKALSYYAVEELSAEDFRWNWMGIRYPEVVRVSLSQVENVPVIKISNIVGEVIKVNEISAALDNGTVIPISTEEFELGPYLNRQGLSWLRLDAPELLGVDLSSVKIIGQATISSRPEDEVYSFEGGFIGSYKPDTDVGSPEKVIELQTVLPGLELKGNAITVKSGTYLISKNLEFPEGFSVSLEPGVTFFLEEGVSIVIRGALKAEGTERSPIEFSSAAGEARKWGGLVVLADKNSVSLKYVVLSHSAGARQLNPTWDAGLLVSNGRVSIEKIHIFNCSAEDAINIVGGIIEAALIKIVDSRSDGLDIDFADGLIEKSSIYRAGGDGVDLSSSKISIRDLTVVGAADKAISIGENSLVTATDLDIKTSTTGIAVKDSSTLKISGLKLDDITESALFAYRKKTIFKGGVILASEVKFGEVNRVATAQFGSVISLNGEEVVPEEVDVDALYSTEYMAR